MVSSETTKVNLYLPSASGSSSILNGINSVTNFSSSTQVGTFNAPKVETSYLEILPTGFGTNGGVSPVNCYLVVVNGPEDFMRVNRCGMETTSGGNQFTPAYEFGTYLGLRTAGSSLELDVPSGKNRQIHLIGFHAISSSECTDVRNGPKKNFMSYPYWLGESGLINLDGTKREVTINLKAPSEAQRLDGCDINVASPNEPPAERISLDSYNFPYGNYYKSDTATPACEPLVFSLLQSSANNYKPGVLDYDSTYSLVASGGASTDRTISTYESYAECTNNVSQTTFAIPAGKPDKKVWVQLSSSDPTTTNFRAVDSAGVITSANGDVVVTADATSAYAYDMIGLPQKMVRGLCYNFKVGFRNLHGGFPGGPGTNSANIELKSDVSPSIGTFYPNANCAAGPVTSVSWTSTSLTSSEYSVLVDPLVGANESAYFSLIQPGIQSELIRNTKIPVRIAQSAEINPVLSRINMSGLDEVSYGTVGLCLPITVLLQDQYGFPIAATANDKIQVFPTALNGLNLYTNNFCVTLLALSQDIAITAGNMSFTFYVSVPTGAPVGLRRVGVNVNSSIGKIFRFNLNGL